MTLVIAHRGASVAEPENTLAAFERAVAMGAEGIELDVRRTADDQLVVLHNPTLADGRVLRSTDASELPPDLPRLADALDACEGAFVNIEIKNDPRDPDFDTTEWVTFRLAAELAGRGGGSRWLVSSFRRETVAMMRTILPTVPTALLCVGMGADEIAAAVTDGHRAIHPWDGALTEEQVAAAHRAGLAVNTWTCDDPARMVELMAWGIDGICTNVPDIALGVRRRP